MQYDFSSASLKLVDFMDAYTTCISISTDINIITTTGLYEKVFHILENSFEEEELMSLYQEISEYKISKEVPYAIMSNEIYGLKNLLISNFSQKTSGSEIVKVLTLFQKISNKVAHLYLLKYIEKLISLNNVRLSSISDLVEKNIISYYESHLIWLTELAEHIKNTQKQNFPELDASTCEFGKWLEGDAKKIISNNSKYKNMVTMHNNLHLLAVKTLNILDLGEYHVLITYLEKCELISLSIGTELALLDQILINKKITKDTLTGALNRHGLRSVFESQYELALATSNPFIVAMCDLDFFKHVNDTYGHIAGDRVLKLFVDTVKKNIRNSDVIIRYGGEEFVIILSTIQKQKGYEVLNKICQEFQKTSLTFEGQEISTTVSIGMVEIQPDYLFKQNFLDDYLMIADKKLYQAKDSGRNRVVA